MIIYFVVEDYHFRISNLCCFGIGDHEFKWEKDIRVFGSRLSIAHSLTLYPLLSGMLLCVYNETKGKNVSWEQWEIPKEYNGSHECQLTCTHSSEI